MRDINFVPVHSLSDAMFTFFNDVDLGQSKQESTYKTFDEVHVTLLMMVKL